MLHAKTLDATILHAKHRITTTYMYNNGVHYIKLAFTMLHACIPFPTTVKFTEVYNRGDEWTAICACMYCTKVINTSSSTDAMKLVPKTTTI